MLSWHFVTAAEYYAASPTYDDQKLYFLSDTGEIYKGSVPFSEAVVLVDDKSSDFDSALALVTNPARRKLYISEKTLEGRTYNGTDWVTVIRPVDSTVTEEGENPVSGAAVAAYVAAEIAKVTGGTDFVKNIAYDKGSHALTITGGEGSPNLTLDGFGVEMTYDPGTGKLELKDCQGVVLGSAVNLDLERFVSAAAYDSAKKQILLAFTDVVKIDTGASYTYPGTMPGEPSEGLACRTTDGKWYIYQTDSWTEIPTDETPLTIEVGDLVDTYTAGSTNSITLSVSGNQFTGEVKIDSTKGDNTLTVSENGLYVAPTKLDDLMKLVAEATEDNIATFGAGGQVKDSGKKIGGATLSANDANTLATEAAVEAVRATLQSAIDGKVNTVAGTADNLVTLNGDGQMKDSGKKIGGATMTAKDENTLATEAAVDSAITEATKNLMNKSVMKTTVESSDTDDTVPTSQAVVEALSWVTTM